MNQNSYTPSQLQSIIQKYQNELMDYFNRKVIPDTQMPDLPAPKKSVQSPQQTGFPKAKSTSLAVEDDCPPSPSMLRPVQDPIRNADSRQPVYAPASIGLIVSDSDCPPPPSMLRPKYDIWAAARAERDENVLKTSRERNLDFVEEVCHSPSKFRPFRTDKRAVLSSMLPPDNRPANIQVRVTTGRTPVPVCGAKVTIIRNGASTQKIQKTSQTDSSGSTPVLSIPSCNPPAPCTIEVTANGYCSARYSGIPLYNGITAIQNIDLVRLPSGQKPDFVLQFDGSPSNPKADQTN